MLRIFVFVLTVALPSIAASETLHPITDRASFLALIEGRELWRMGIRLVVHTDGRIEGRALGRPVTGSWQWEDQHFCRAMQWGDRKLDYNCQTVRLKGDALRFTSDRGQGDYADLKLR